MKASSPYTAPEHIFAVLALLFGVAYAMLLPPLAGADEYFHYQRIISIAYGTWLNSEAQVPSGIARFMQKTVEYNTAGTLLPYSAAHWYEVAAIPLAADTMSVIKPNYLTIHSFINYLPQAAVVRLMAAGNASPLMLLYGARLTGLLFSVWLTCHAIRLMPAWRYGLCALALLPPLEFYRICLSADTVTVSVGLLFLSRMSQEIVREGFIKRAALMRLAVLGFMFPFCKMPYGVTSLMCLAIPRRRFTGAKERWRWCALIILPGLLAGMWWMQTARTGYYAGQHYETWAGSVFPDKQVAYMLAQPVTFGMALLRTLFSFSLYADALREMFGHLGTMQQQGIAYYAMITLLLIAVLWMDGTSVRATYSLPTKILVIPLVLAFLMLTLTAIYIQWNGVGAEVIKGFQGRYFYPLLPLFLMLLPAGRPHAPARSALAVSICALTGLGLTLPMLLAHWV